MRTTAEREECESAHSERGENELTPHPKVKEERDE